LIETVACQHIIRRRNYIQDESLLKKLYEDSEALAKKLQAFRKSITQYQVRENTPTYGDEDLT